MKFTKSFYGCKAGDIYPTRFNAGDECPKELEAAAIALGAAEAEQPKRKVKADGNADA